MPKQWQTVAGRRVADWTVDAFHEAPGIDLTLVMVAPDIDPAIWPYATERGVLIGYGGATRPETVAKGLDLLAEAGIERVLIHDVARPGVSPAIIARVLAALDTHQGAAPALPVTDALWHGDGTVTATQDRTGLWRAQTPQGFHLPAIRAAHATFEGTPADDVEVALAAGLSVAIVPGSEDNLKITTPEDFARAARVLAKDAPMDIRTGNGFDVHRFGPGDQVMLAGVAVPHDRGLQGHSDADVGLHTVTDAIYGALAEGDIGTHFPPSDPQWKGAESHIFLTHAVDLAVARGFVITHADLTLICEQPKIGPHASAMRARLAELLRIERSRVSVKATTTERLGFPGRGEGIAALATVTLVGTR